jgi:hypothetical protein
MGQASFAELLGKSPPEVATLIGPPLSTKETEVAEEHVFADGRLEVAFVDGTAALLRFKPKGSMPFSSESMALLGLEAREPDERDGRTMRWRQHSSFKEVVFIAPKGKEIATVVIDLDGRFFAARDSASRAAAAQTFAPTGIGGVPPINRDLQNEALRVVSLLDKAVSYDISSRGSNEFVNTATTAEAAAISLEQKLSRSDPRRDLVVNATQALQGLVLALASGSGSNSLAAEELRTTAKIRLGMLSALLNDDFTPETKALFEAWMEQGQGR